MRALPARNLAIVNGHGGNRGILENLLQELRGDLALNACVIHPFDLAKAGCRCDGWRRAWRRRRDFGHAGAGARAGARRDDREPGNLSPAPDSVAALIFDRGVTWPWRTDDPRLAQTGIIGDPSAASPERGRAMVEGMMEAAGLVFARLLENQSMVGKVR